VGHARKRSQETRPAACGAESRVTVPSDAGMKGGGRVWHPSPRLRTMWFEVWRVSWEGGRRRPISEGTAGWHGDNMAIYKGERAGVGPAVGE
jgi:hypothetical protein